MRSLIVALLALSSVSFAQTEFDTYSKKYPNQNGVFLKKNVDVNISVDKKGDVVVELNHDAERLFLNDNFKYYMEDAVGYSSFSEVSDLSPSVYIPNGEKYKKVKITDWVVEDETDGSVFHDDYKNNVFYYRGLMKGGKTALSYTKKMKNPYFFGTFYFSTYLPVEKTEYVVTTPADMTISYTLFGEEKDKIAYSVETKGSQKIHRWTGKGLSELKFEDGSVDISYIATHIQLHIESYKHKGEDKHLLRDVDDLYAYYRTFVNDINAETPELNKIADSLTTGLSTNAEKVEAIFYWVQDNIKYVAFEDGMGGFVPREAELVCERKYGDCKDMSSILYAMINSVGIPAYYTWIGSRDIPYDYTDVPTTATDNHMICSWHDGEKYVFLDATSKGIPYGFPSGFTQGKQALIGINKDKYELVHVPVVSAEDNGMYDTVYVNIEDELVKGAGKVTYYGYQAVNLTDLINNLTDRDKEDFYKESWKKGNNKCKSQVTTEKGLDRRGGPLEMDYEFEIPDYIKSYEDEMYFNPFLKRYFSGANVNKETTNVSKEVPYKDLTIGMVYVNVPEGYEVTYVPEGFKYEHEDFMFEIALEFDKEKGQIAVKTVFNIDHLILDTKHFDAWNEMIKKLNRTYSEVITFKKKA
jgi:hypothetical protein